jgi:hypothetical protein
LGFEPGFTGNNHPRLAACRAGRRFITHPQYAPALLLEFAIQAGEANSAGGGSIAVLALALAKHFHAIHGMALHLGVQGQRVLRGIEEIFIRLLLLLES